MESQYSAGDLALFKTQKEQLLEHWFTELKENPHMKNKDLLLNSNLKSYSSSMLNELLQTMNAKEIPNLNKTAIEPILKMWHNLLQEQVAKGFSAKDTALLIYALKTSIIKHYQNEEGLDKGQVDTLEQILDILGILTFEMYSAEKESVISQKDRQIQYLQHHQLSTESHIIGNSTAMKALYQTIGLVLENNITVLLQGESGTGKDLVAHIIHINSKRKAKPFVAVNCGAIPNELLESELFGHEKGAFTDAQQSKVGKFELAQGGTLFLDEISELPLPLQVKLLRALQNKEIERVGGKGPIPIDIRIIAAANKDLKTCVDEQTFRLDLFYRLNVFPIQLPALREREEDVVLLAHHFIEKYAEQFEVSTPGLTKDAESYLMQQYWEGNVRELENCCQRSVILAQGQPITEQILRFEPGSSLQAPAQLSAPKQARSGQIVPLEEIEKQAIIDAIKIKKSNLLQVAQALQISRTTLYNKLKKYHIDPQKEKGDL